MKLFFFIILFIAVSNITYAQKNTLLALKEFTIIQIQKSQEKLEKFNSAIGLQILYRQNLGETNYLTLGLATTQTHKNLYNVQSVRFGVECGNVLKVKNLFSIVELVVRRFRSKTLDKTSFTVAPSIGHGYNLKLYKSLSLRSYINFEYNIPNKIAPMYINFNMGLHWGFEDAIF